MITATKPSNTWTMEAVDIFRSRPSHAVAALVKPAWPCLDISPGAGSERSEDGRPAPRQDMATYRIAVIPGDGIGKEVVPEGQRVLEAAGESTASSSTGTSTPGAASTSRATGG